MHELDTRIEHHDADRQHDNIINQVNRFFARTREFGDKQFDTQMLVMANRNSHGKESDVDKAHQRHFLRPRNGIPKRCAQEHLHRNQQRNEHQNHTTDPFEPRVNDGLNSGDRFFGFHEYSLLR